MNDGWYLAIWLLLGVLGVFLAEKGDDLRRIQPSPPWVVFFVLAGGWVFIVGVYTFINSIATAIEALKPPRKDGK